MSDKKRIILICVCAFLIILLLVLVGLLVILNKKGKTSNEVSNPINEQVVDEQISGFQDLKIIEDLLKSGKKLNENIGNDLDDNQKGILKNLGVNKVLFDTYKVYTSKELLDSGFISAQSEAEQQIEEWESTYKNEKYIISQSQELAFVANGRKDENDIIQYARLVDDDELDVDTSAEEIEGKEENTTINIRKVERLKYNVTIDYPKDAVELKYAIKINDKETSNQSTSENLDLLQESIVDTYIEESTSENLAITLQDDENSNIDYDSLKWLNYDDTIFVEENATIYTKYKLNFDDVEYTIGNYRKVPELILSKPTYEIVEDESSMYVKFSNIESSYNKKVKFKVSYGKKETEEEPLYSDWFEAQDDKFIIEDVAKYFIKFVAVIEGQNVTDSDEMKISIGRVENQDTPNSIVDTTQEDIVQSSNASLISVKVNGVNVSNNIINSLDLYGVAQYSVSNVSSVMVKAYAQDPKANVIGNGSYNFKNDKATVTIQIVAEDGTKRTYTLIITRNSSVSNSTSSSNTTTTSNNNTSNSSSNSTTPGSTSSNTSNNNSSVSNQSSNTSTPSSNNTSNNNTSGNTGETSRGRGRR